MKRQFAVTNILQLGRGDERSSISVREMRTSKLREAAIILKELIDWESQY